MSARRDMKLEDYPEVDASITKRHCRKSEEAVSGNAQSHHLLDIFPSLRAANDLLELMIRDNGGVCTPELAEKHLELCRNLAR